MSISFFILSCSTQSTTQNEKQNLHFSQDDEDEYDIVVFDPQYEIFLRTIAQPKTHHAESYYKSKNQFYVSEWNYRHNNPLQFNSDLYAVSIDYNSKFDYGLDFEYKLYNFFKFIEWKYRVSLDFGR